jgi:hypothetical protein
VTITRVSLCPYYYFVKRFMGVRNLLELSLVIFMYIVRAEIIGMVVTVKGKPSLEL